LGARLHASLTGSAVVLALLQCVKDIVNVQASLRGP